MATAASTTSMSSVAARNQPTIIDLVPFTSIGFLDDEPIGYGAFGAVYKALHNGWGCQVAYKKLDVPHIGKRSEAEKQLVFSNCILSETRNITIPRGIVKRTGVPPH